MLEGSVVGGKYRIVSLLGRGGMGAVWRAEHLGLNAPVAVKILDPYIALTGDGRTRFHREAQAAASLRSPHVVQILDHGIDEATGSPFIAMELMEGESLAQRIARQGTLSPAETARVVTHVARALTRAHDTGIVHRDLKPDNVFLVRNEDEEIAKVLDFGIAKSQAHGVGKDSATRTGAVMGTPYYMSPEQISGAKGLDFRTDLWALAIIACECLTGRRPFDAETVGGLALKICAEPIPRPSSLGPVPSGFDPWFERAAARDPALRFQSARALADELRRLCSGEVAAAVSPAQVGPAPQGVTFANSTSPLSRTAPREETTIVPARSSRGRMIGAAVATATALGGFVLWASRGTVEPAAEPVRASGAISATVPPAEAIRDVVAPTPVEVVAPAPSLSTAPAAAPEPAPTVRAPERRANTRSAKVTPVQSVSAAADAGSRPPPPPPSAAAKSSGTPRNTAGVLNERR